MKLKYYLRGLGIGIIVTTIILMIAYSGYTKELTDEEIIARAESLGMVMQEDTLFSNLNKNSETTSDTEANGMDNTSDVERSEGTENSEMFESTEDIAEKDTETGSEEVTTEELYRLVIPSGSVPRLICNELEENGVIESAESLRKYLAEVGYAKMIKVGEYDIPYGATNEEIYYILQNERIVKKQVENP